jgi:hypothetical protein
MSFGASAVAWHHSQAKGTDLLVLMSLANYINDDGAWPKVETIAKGARTSVRQVHRSLAVLKELGEIDWQHGAGVGRGVYKSNLYKLLLKCPAECSGDWNHTMRQSVTSGTDVMSRGDNLSGLGVTHTADKPITEPVKEPVIKATTNKPHLLNESWLPDDRLIGMFVTKWPLLNMSEQTEAFKLHHMAKGSKMVDWGLAYQNWMNRAQGWAAEKQPKDQVRKIVGDF